MKHSKRALCLLLAALMIFFVSCNKKDKINTVTVPPEDVVVDENGDEITINSDSVFMLPYSKGDSLNPFLAASLNNQLLASLLYQPLFRLSEAYTPENILADSYETADKTIRVTLKTGVHFSDGTAVSASDVVYSFNQAKNAPAYSANLSGFASASAKDSATVVFTLAAPNANAVNNLTFPVVKKDSASPKSNETAVGSGRFILEHTGGDCAMKPNPAYQQSVILTNIRLINIETRTSLNNALKIGNISFAFQDLSDGNSATLNVKTQKVPLNNLVYLGLNQSNGYLSDSKVRRAVSFAVNRENIVTSAYHGFAAAAVSVFNPEWKTSQGAVIASSKHDTTAAKTTLEASTYGGAALKLIVNSENGFRATAADLIAKQMNAQGFNVTVSKLAYGDYMKALQTGAYDLYLGEVRLTNDMSLQPFFSQGGACSYGISLAAEDPVISSYNSYMAGSEVGSFIMSFQENMPFVPIVYRSGLVAYTNQMKVKPTSTYGDIFNNIEEWTF